MGAILPAAALLAEPPAAPDAAGADAPGPATPPVPDPPLALLVPAAIEVAVTAPVGSVLVT